MKFLPSQTLKAGIEAHGLNITFAHKTVMSQFLMILFFILGFALVATPVSDSSNAITGHTSGWNIDHDTSHVTESSSTCKRQVRYGAIFKYA